MSGTISSTSPIHRDVMRKAISGIILFILGSLGLYMIGFGNYVMEQISESILPKDAIIAFDDKDCPSGWEKFEHLEGRTIIGAGRGVKYKEEDKGRNFNYRDDRGEEKHWLSFEIPYHIHGDKQLTLEKIKDDFERVEEFKIPDDSEIRYRLPYRDDSIEYFIAHVDGVAKSEEFRTNMQPFYVLTYCVRE